MVLGRRLNGKKRCVTIWMLIGFSLTTLLTGCGEKPGGGTPTAVPDATEIHTPAPVDTNTAEPTAAGTSTPTSTATGTPPPTLTPTMTLCPMEVTATSIPTSTPLPLTPATAQWQATYQDLMPYGFNWDRYFLENPGETEAVVMARFGVGEAAPGNTYDQDLIMWTLRIRKEIGMTRPGAVPTINAVVTNGGAFETLLVLKGETGRNPYTNPQIAAEEGRCGENVMKMIYPCTPNDVDTLNRAYIKAIEILDSDIQNVPLELRYFESFEGAGGTEGTYCHWGDTDTTHLRPSARLAGPGGTVFQDCVLKDNREIWGQE